MIELIVVIVILGILAATALPKFIDMGSNARQAALDGVVGAAASAYTINYSGCSAVQHVATANKCVKVFNCSDTPNIMQGGLPAGYTVAAGVISAGTAGTNGTEAVCTMTQVVGTQTATATFKAISAGNGL